LRNWSTQYLDRITGFAERLGYLRTEEIRSHGDAQDPYRHLKWLVRWQLQGWTMEAIAKREGEDVAETAISGPQEKSKPQNNQGPPPNAQSERHPKEDGAQIAQSASPSPLNKPAAKGENKASGEPILPGEPSPLTKQNGPSLAAIRQGLRKAARQVGLELRKGRFSR